MPTVRELADNEWLLLLSRAAAALSVPALMGAFVFAWDMNAQQAVTNATLTRHEREIGINAERIALREANAFTATDAAAMEARVQRDLERLIEEIRLLREQADRDRRQQP